MSRSRQRAADFSAGYVYDSSGATLSVSDNRKRSIAVKLTMIARQLRQRFDCAVEGDGPTRVKWQVIVAVARNPGATQRAIAALLEITEVTAGQLIDRLCADGYIERREHPKDGRAYCVHLMPAAQSLLGRLDAVARVHEEQAFAGLDDADLSRLEAILCAMAHNLAASRNRDEALTSLDNMCEAGRQPDRE